jgi:hypothetical protein
VGERDGAREGLPVPHLKDAPQYPDAQSVSSSHISPSSHRLAHSEPPQSMSDSVPS